MDAQLYTVLDRGRQIIFRGELLGQATSYADYKPRWFTVEIYKTEGGKYIVAGAGRSVVVHLPTCGRLKGRVAESVAPTAEQQPCETCAPLMNGSELVVPETDREWAQVSDEPEAVIERLRLHDPDGVFYLPTTSSRALQQAAASDGALADALLAPQHVD